MFYSQIILAKKGPLGKVWQAAHWGDKKLGRPAIFATDISATVDTIVHPSAPMALRVSGHLLLGVVRIYSRQVKFLLDDCQQAMVKVKMAYNRTDHTTVIDIHVQNNGSSIGGGTGGSKGGTTNVANFGEFQPVELGTVTDFMVPVFADNESEDEQDWVPAEFDENPLHGQENSTIDNPYTDDAAVQAADQTLEEEDWGVFDPNDEDEEEDNKDTSTVSDIEQTRAANESLTSDPSLRRASVLNDNSNISVTNAVSVAGEDATEKNTEFPRDGSDVEDFPVDDGGDVMMDDEPEEDGTNLFRQRRSLRLSASNDDSNIAPGISFGDDEGSLSKASDKRKSTNERKKKPRKRRKLILDDGATELTTEHIRNMLADTSKVVAEQAHPSSWVPSQMGVGVTEKQLILGRLTHEQFFQRPGLGDDGQLGPGLLRLWSRNMAPVGGLAFDYFLENAPVISTEANTSKDMEVARHAEHALDGIEEPQGDDDFPEAENFDAFPEDASTSIPFEDPDDQVGFDDAGGNDFPATDSLGKASQRSFESVFSLGATNGLDDDFGDNGGAEMGNHSASSKWHKNTLKVFDVLTRNMATQDNDEHIKQHSMSFNTMCSHVSRRTAAGVFFELLQLKTLNYIELNQGESYGDIRVSPGIKFLEDPP